MLKLSFSAFFIALLIFSGFSYAADPYTLSVVADKKMVDAGETIRYTFSVTNNQDSSKTAEIYVWESKFGWTFYDPKYLSLKSEETGTFRVFITPPYNTPTGFYDFVIKVYNSDNSDIYSEKSLRPYVQENVKVDLTLRTYSKEGIRISKYLPGEPVELEVLMKNTGTRTIENHNLSIKILKNDTAIKETLYPIIFIDVGDESSLKHTFNFDRYKEGGIYYAVATVLDEDNITVSENSIDFVIEETAVFSKTSSESGSAIISRNYEIAVQNNGNKWGTEYVRAPYRGYFFLYSYSKKPSIVDTGSGKELVWRCDIAPQQTCVISYSFKYWMVWTAILLLIILSVISYRKYTKPCLHKKHIKKGDIHAVHLHIKNRSRSSLNNVVVEDFIPNLVKVSRKFDVREPTKFEKTDGGARITWVLGTIAPGEERVLTYKVKPVIDVEDGIVLPPATITAQEENTGRKHEVRSGKLELN